MQRPETERSVASEAGIEEDDQGPKAERPLRTDVAERITAVLNAADDAAERIRAGAREEAAAILRHAHEVAAARVEELTREPERLRAEAEAEALSTRRAAEGYAAEQRRAAEERAREMVASAERQADELRTTAEEAVRAIEEEGRKRQLGLAAQIRSLTDVRDQAVDAIRKAIEAYRTATSALEQAVHELRPATDADGSADEGSPRRPWRLLHRSARAPSQPARVEEAGPLDDGSAPARDLYERAKALGIRGRSKMTKQELEEAVKGAE